MNVSVFGLGYVGCVTAACLARNGHTVVGLDVNGDKVAMINEGRAPIVEPGLGELIQEVVAAKRLRATTDLADAVAHSSIGLICVGTPGVGGGQPSLDAVARIGREVGRVLRDRRGQTEPLALVLRSTALPGTTETVLLPALRAEAGPHAAFRIAVNPEFMREGASLRDFDHPPFVLVGCDDRRMAALMRTLYAGVKAQVVRTSIRTAELVKYASNAYHGLKVAFANEMGDLADALGADGREVMRVFALDRKLNVSSAYLRPGFAFGGSCLPKDIRALLWAGRVHDVETPVLGSILPSNESQIRSAIDRVLALGRRRVGVVGLAFKPDTDDLRESPVVRLVEALIGKGLDVRVLDRNVSIARLVGANRQYIETEIPHIATLLCGGPDELAAHAETIVIGSESDDAKRVLELAMSAQGVVDLTRSFRGGREAVESGAWA
jgi:GDP-mannose 6-dehydrogenase